MWLRSKSGSDLAICTVFIELKVLFLKSYLCTEMWCVAEEVQVLDSLLSGSENSDVYRLNVDAMESIGEKKEKDAEEWNRIVA